MMVHIKFPDDHIIGLHMELFSRTTLVIALDALSLLFFIFINSTDTRADTRLHLLLLKSSMACIMKYFSA